MNKHGFDGRGSPAERATPIRTLIVDDSRASLTSLRAFLKAETALDLLGLATDGQDAVRLSQALHPDLVLMDVQMPRLNGLEATQQIKAGSPAPKIILITIHSGPEIRARAQAAGADGFLTKSELGEHLLPAIFKLFPRAIRTES